MNRKVTVVGGAGNVGATVARAIANRELADVVVIDIAETKAQGIALDILQACPIEGSDARLIGGNRFEDSADSDVVVITSGVPRKPGMSRDDLLQVNYNIMKDVTEQIVKHSPNCIIVPVANPLDAMCQAVYRLSGFPRERVIGMAGVLDSARMRTFIAQALDVSVENVHAFVLGGHGDTMVPLPRYSTVAGVPITELLPADQIAAIVKRTAEGGAEITKLVGTSAWYAPGTRGRRNGGSDPEGQEEDPAVFGLPAGRVRRARSLRRRAREARRARCRADHAVHADGGRDRRPPQVGGRGEGTHGRDQGLIRCASAAASRPQTPGLGPGGGLRPAPRQPVVCSPQPELSVSRSPYGLTVIGAVSAVFSQAIFSNPPPAGFLSLAGDGGPRRRGARAALRGRAAPAPARAVVARRRLRPRRACCGCLHRRARAWIGATENFGATYGPLAGTIAILLWTFLTAVAVLLGLAFAAQLEAVRAGVTATRVDARRELRQSRSR